MKNKNLTKTKLNQFRKLFLQKQNELLAQCKNSESIQDFANGGDEVDIAQSMVINSMVEKLLVRDAQTMKKIDEALERIEQGTFGICEECSLQIPEKRLLAMPYSMTCVDCAEQQEKIARQYRR